MYTIIIVIYCFFIQFHLFSAAPQTFSSYTYSRLQCQYSETSDDKCLHGTTEGPCGAMCLKGPGEICGGNNNMYGVCGDGLSCSNCNRCSGCSFTTFTCHDEDHCISAQDYWLASLTMFDPVLDFLIVTS